MDPVWYYAQNETQKGPVSPDDLLAALIRGEIDRQALVWRPDMGGWQRLENVEELEPLLVQVPPASPTKPPPLPPPIPPPPIGSEAPPDPVEDASEEPSPSAKEVVAKRLVKTAGWVVNKTGDSLWKKYVDPEDCRPTSGAETSPTAGGGEGAPARPSPTGWFARLTTWLANKVGHVMWERLVSTPALTLIAMVSVGAVMIPVVRSDPPASRATGQIQIDAKPWGEVAWIRGAGGAEIDVPGTRTTPLALSLPTGRYTVQVDYSPGKASKRCELQVVANQTATCWLELASIDATSYFDKIGW